MKRFALILLLVVAALIIAALLMPRGERGTQRVEGLPWQIETLAGGGSKVFGLTLGQSTIGDAAARFGTDKMELAVIAATGEQGSLEAYYSDATAGLVTGKMIFVGVVDTDTLARLKRDAIKTEYMYSATRQYTLSPDDMPLAYRAPIGAITFIPAINLDEQLVLARFGLPAERIRTDEHTEHLLYPEKGLDVILDSKGKEVLQYVAPREFAHLRDPLIKGAKSKAGA